MKYAVVNELGEIVNIVLWDGEQVWTPGPGLRAIPAADDDVIGAAVDPQRLA